MEFVSGLQEFRPYQYYFYVEKIKIISQKIQPKTKPIYLKHLIFSAIDRNFGDFIGMRYAGKITTWKDDKGFGFITINDTKNRVFIHVNAFGNRARRPIEGDSITFEVTQDKQGRPNATNVKLANEKTKMNPTVNASISFSQIFAMTFSIVLLSLLTIGKIPLSVVGVYLILGGITFIAYAIDKAAAQNNKWRTKESTLHVLSLLGGWLGALLAQKKLRHKSQKKEFQTVLWTTIILNCAAFGWLLKQGYFESWKNMVGF